MRSLILLARQHDHEEYQVSEAAQTLDMSLTNLNRLSLEELGYSPGIVIDLARVESVALEVVGTRMTLGMIAKRHGFIDHPAMNHRFARFVGLTPGIYRSRALLRRNRG